MNLNNLTLSEKRTIQALLIALMELDSPLSADLQDNVHDIGVFLSTNPETAFSRLNNLLAKDEHLKDLYEKARKSLREEYQIKERDKSEVIADSLTFDDLAIDILNAGNDIARVKDELYNKIKDSTNSFAKLLTKTISISKQKEDIKLASILKALEFHPLTIRDLAYSLNISIDESRLLVKRLWDQGKINTLESNILGNIFPFFRKKVAVSKLDETRTHFTLTSVGHFQLHPVIKY